MITQPQTQSLDRLESLIPELHSARDEEVVNEAISFIDQALPLLRHFAEGKDADRRIRIRCGELAGRASR